MSTQKIRQPVLAHRPPPVANEAGRRAQLARFGYLPESQRASGLDYDAEWDTLRADFQTLALPQAPSFDQLPASLGQKARSYIDQRRALDGLMDECDRLHHRIMEAGARSELVEEYTEARDIYEDAVEDFGTMRAELQESLESHCSVET